MKLNLTLHCGAANVGRDEISRVTTPEPTSTWTPISHHLFLQQVETALFDRGLEVTSEAHALAKDGKRYFGLLQVDQREANGRQRDYAFVAGLRNSHDKTFPAGLVIGDGVFVCDNLSFSGEIQFARRHTPRILEALPGLTGEAVEKLQAGWTKQDARVDGYKGQEIDDKDAHDLVVKAFDKRAISLSQVPKILHEWREPRHEEFRIRNIWSLFNCFTEIMKSTGLVKLPRRTIRLQEVLDQRCEVLWN